ncbi:MULTISPECIES: HAMP domain-containing sensor histidine kinase [unclassified Spirosoma]|uniref:sensor histidine kinase n=1 Tax=unclassified Spirosoma TaxID=2621999 RepID=UPI00095ACBAD|nr:MULTISPECIES: HAMP domain-containing sensor histidine kinase [unclassified Spirosoma]MBN8824263.1 HAMP domain-containing histidine kinase [Spirosoma sp.]OJW78993.1 MAG: two-component sensor histidine kinase [Spirosoma sp. 48-14]
MTNIRTRLTVQFALLVTVILLLFSLGVYFFSKLYLEKRFFKRLQDRAITTTTLLFDLQQTDSTVLRVIDAGNKEPLLNENISIYNAKTKQVLFSNNPANTRFHEQFIPQLDSTAQTLYMRQHEYQVVAIHLAKTNSSDWVIVSGIDQTGHEALDDLKKILIVMVLAALLLLGISGWFFADRALAPMSGIVQQVNTIFPADVSKRVEHPNRSDEIGVLVATFNQLLDRVEQAINKQKMFIANVSHELKNPLTKINSQIDVALIQKRNPDAYERTLQSLQEDTRHLAQLTNTLLDLANTSMRADTLAVEPVRMDELLWESKTQLQSWHENYQIQLTFSDFPDEEEALITQGNRAALKVLLMNLLDNACKFSPGKTAQVTFQAKANTIIITVFNEGPQIPEADLPYIFQPFFRSNATAPSSKGHGVGLAVVAQVVEIHKGSISVKSTQEGTTFTLTLPSSASF